MIRRAVLALALLLSTGIAAPAFAEITPPSNNIHETIDKVCDVVQKEGKSLSDEALDEKLKALIFPLFDFGEMSRRSLGAYWSKATPEEQKEFVELFSDLLSRTYLKRIKRNAEDSKIAKMTEDVTDDKAMVHSIIVAQGEEISIDYRLVLQGDKWKIYDVIIENVGLVSNYRNEFPAIIRKDGFPGLLKRLRDKQIETTGRP